MRLYNKLDFSEEVLARYKKLYGSFKNDDQLTKKEYRSLGKLKKVMIRKEAAKANKKLKKESTEPIYKTDLPQCSNAAPYEKRKPRPSLASSLCKQRIAIDLSYMNEDIMVHKDLRMCAKQVTRVYSENRGLDNPLQLHLTSVVDKACEILSYNQGFKNWDIHKHKESYEETFDLDDIVYLSSDSENVIEKLDNSKVYIIGGLLDHNSKKGLSHDRAMENRVAHGRLPIDEYMDMKKLKVLPINHVYSIIASVTNGLSWTDSFVNTIPQRKEAKPKNFEEKQLNISQENEPTISIGGNVDNFNTDVINS